VARQTSQRTFDRRTAHAGPLYIAAGTDNHTTNLTVAQQDVILALPASGKTETINLPPPNETRGMFFSITVQTDGDGVGVLQDQNEGDPAYTSGNLTAADDHVVVYSNGMRYIEVAELTT